MVDMRKMVGAAVVGVALWSAGGLPASGQERPTDDMISLATARLAELGFAPFDSRRTGELRTGGVAREETERVSEPSGLAGRHDGALDAGDDRYPTGEFFDTYALDARAGETLVADLRADDFDTYLNVEAPSGAFWTSDLHDQERDARRSRLEIEVEETGRWTARVTSLEPGSTGCYALLLDSRVPEVRDLLDRPGEGSLTSGDQRLKDGRYGDTYVFQGTAGDRVTVDLRTAGGFRSLLMLFAPHGELVAENDQYESSRNHARIQVDLASSGEYRALVTSYRAGGVGSYELSVTAEGAARSVRPEVRCEQGRPEQGGS